MNDACSQAKYQYISIFSTNNYYGDYFLVDLMLAFDYTEAAVIGKHRKVQHQYVNDLEPLSIIFRRHLHEKNAFAAVDSLTEMMRPFIKECSRQNFQMYAADRYNFVKLPSAGAINNIDNVLVKKVTI